MRRPDIAKGDGSGPTAGSPAVRAPAVGQSWRYSKRDIFTHTIVDDQIDRVAAVGRTIDIDSRSEASKNGKTEKWGTAWLRKYIPRRELPEGPLPSEIQAPWGQVLVDPHWSQVQVYEAPIPLWPAQLTPGWKTHFNTKYKTPSNEDGLPWDQTMAAHEWQTISVAAGNFRALRFTNVISFKSADFSRETSQRKETIWFAPEVGRWVARESTGTYYIEDSSVDTPYDEPGFRWELTEFT
ncbi:MAG TPA: hypothetical protein VK794_13310 [Steroidobacteraceae bacterium]|jgi:hypothetical protein|nr:hypothetical protein [Steroidobacteraceae bacterium]